MEKIDVGILGLSADPPTLGHIQLAQFVLNSCNLDEVWLLPANIHVYNKNMVDSNHRLKMCEIAAKVDKRIKVFDYEIINNLKGDTYTFLKNLKNEKDLNDNFNFSLIIGLDNANTFNKWKNYKKVEKMIKFIVVSRNGIERDLNVNWYLKSPHVFLEQKSQIVQSSSSQIRENLKNKNVDSTIDKNVLNYILKNKLYKN